MAAAKLIDTIWMKSYHDRLIDYLNTTYYDKDKIDDLLSKIESGNVETIHGTQAEIDAMDLSIYPNGTIVVVEG